MNKDLVNTIDKDNMFNVIVDFYKHIKESFDIIEKSNININLKPNNIIICGMGGSAIGGDFVKTILLKKINIPIYVNRDYFLPKWVNENSLVILCSYSGNTEETISCLKEVEKLNINPFIISSGGELLSAAKKSNYYYVKLPEGIQPRAAFGYSASLLLLLLNKIDIVDKDIIDDLYFAIDELKKSSDEFSSVNDENNAILFASKIHDKYPLIYGTSSTDVISLRFRCQLAENTKILSSHFMMPEQNHNDIEGFNKLISDDHILIWIYDLEDQPENINRMNITSELLSNTVKNHYFFKEDGKSLVSRTLKLIYFFDWVSFYGSIFNNINPTPVNKILQLKSLMK